MEFLNKYNITFSKLLKAIGIAIVIIILASFAFRLIGTSVSSIANTNSRKAAPSSAPSSYSYGLGNVVQEKALSDSFGASLSVRNIAPTPPYDRGYTSGDDAEAYRHHIEKWY